MKVRVFVSLKKAVLDPQGKAIETTLAHMGHKNVSGVRQGKFIDLTINETDATKARAQLTSMCDKLLANTVIEDYQIEIDGQLVDKAA